MSHHDPIHHERTGAGAPLLLIHGLGSDLSVWEPVRGELAVSHEVIAVDLPGFGRSRPLAGHVPPTPGALAGRLAALLDELGIAQAHVAGNSLGGWVALELALLGRARSVAGICPAGLWTASLSHDDAATRGGGQRLARRLRPLIPALMAVPRLRRAVLSPFVADPRRVPYHAARRMAASYARATAYAATSIAMRTSAFAGADRLEVPVVLAFGEHDRLIRPVRLAAPRVQTLELAGCGHIAMWDDPAAVVAAIRRAVVAGGEDHTPAGAAAGT